MSIGEVVECAHCDGSGDCLCHSCYESAGIEWDVKKIQCAACGGIGKAWIGPKVINIHRDDDDDNDDDN